MEFPTLMGSDKFINIFNKHINTLPHPYNQIQCKTKSKILGHMMTADNSLTIDVLGRLHKAKSAWAKLRTSFITNTNISIKYRLIIPHSIIGSILLYGLHFFNLNNANYSPHAKLLFRMHSRNYKRYQKI